MNIFESKQAPCSDSGVNDMSDSFCGLWLLGGGVDGVDDDINNSEHVGSLHVLLPLRIVVLFCVQSSW